AGVLGTALTILYMIAYYRLLGGLAAVALLCYGLLSFAVLLALRSTLTLPGIAGFVLAIGMAVDANVRGSPGLPLAGRAPRRALAGAGCPRAVVHASGGGDLTVRTGQLDQADEERVRR